jgi:hypothetical protein
LQTYRPTVMTGTPLKSSPEIFRKLSINANNTILTHAKIGENWGWLGTEKKKTEGFQISSWNTGGIRWILCIKRRFMQILTGNLKCTSDTSWQNEDSSFWQ